MVVGIKETSRLVVVLKGDGDLVVWHCCHQSISNQSISNQFDCQRCIITVIPVTKL